MGIVVTITILSISDDFLSAVEVKFNCGENMLKIQAICM
jgi:hypothetical protein